MKGLFAATLVLAMTLNVDAARAATSCEPKVLADVTLRVTPQGQVLLPASLKGHEVFFELNLGEGLPEIRRSAIRALGLAVAPRRGGPQIWQNGRDVTHYAKMQDTRIGELKLVDRGAFILEDDDEAPPSLDGRPIVGVMGSTLVQSLDAELFLAEHRFRLFEPFKCRTRSPVYWEGDPAELPMRFDVAGTLVFSLELEGRKVESGLSMRSPTSSMDVNATRQFFGFDETSPGVDAVDGAFHPMSLTGPGLQIKDARVRLRHVTDCKLSPSVPVYHAIGYSDCINVVPFNVGVDLLSRMRIYISRERQTIFVTVAGG
jgi:hypothetical protein